MSVEYITDLATPAELTGFVREEVDGALPFAGLFPVEQVDDIEYELENVDVRGYNEVARYRSWDTVPPIGRRPGINIIGGEIAPLAWSYRLNEKDLVRLQKTREGVASKTDQRVVDLIFNDSRRAGNAVQNRITLEHARLLQTGMVKLLELGDVQNGNALTANFGVPGSHFVTAATLWSDLTNADAIGNLKAWEDTFAADNGDSPPDRWFISKTVAALLVQHAKLRNLLPFATGQGIGVPAMLTDQVVQTILSQMGVVAPVQVVDVKRPPLAGGSHTSLLNPNLVIGVKAGMGKTLYGIPPVASLLPGNAKIEERDQPGIIAYSQTSIRPPAILTTAEAVSVPVLTDANGLFVATVL